MSPAPEEIIGAARAWLGTPYRHRSATLGAGCDCLGLLRGVWCRLYGSEPLDLPHYAPGWRDPAADAALEQAASELLQAVSGPPQPGHILLFRLRARLPARHCGILVAPDRFIHAQERLGVVEASLGAGWRQRLAACFAFPDREVR